ncbi:MAG TPA: hypothetical protein VMU54_22765, partial [Planctomycetota bacterium]|nr:hypothetical protein [Planctomycetota bacterium]
MSFAESGGKKKTVSSSKVGWRWVHILLTISSITGILLAVSFNHQLTTSYNVSVRTNQEWSRRIGQYLHLARLAARADRLASEVLESHDADKEEAQWGAVFQSWDGDYATLRLDLTRNVSPAQSAPLLKELDEARDAMGELALAARKMFSLAREGKWDLALRQMIQLDRQYDAVDKEMTDAIVVVRDLQERHFMAQREKATRLEVIEYVVATLLIIVVLSASLYGFRLYRTVVETAKDLEAS